MGNVSTGACLGFKRSIIVGHFHFGPVSGLPISVTIQKSHRHNVYRTSFTLSAFKKGIEYFYTMNQATHNNDIRRGSRDHLLINKVRVRSSSFISIGDSFTLLVNDIPFCFWAKFWPQTIHKKVANKSQKIVACIITIYQLHSLPEACNEIFEEYLTKSKTAVASEKVF